MWTWSPWRYSRTGFSTAQPGTLMALQVPSEWSHPPPEPPVSFLPHTTTAGRAHTSRHEELLDGLEELLIAEGFRTLTLADLSDRLHCSRRTLYELAPTKDDLVALVVSRFLDRNYARGVEAMGHHHTAP